MAKKTAAKAEAAPEAVVSLVPDAKTVLAISKCVKEKATAEARAQVGAGTYEIAQQLSLRGILTIGPDVAGGAGYEMPATFSPWLLLALALQCKGAPTADVVAAKAAEVLKAGTAGTAESLLQAQFSVHAAALLPKIHVAGSGSRKGSASFSGVIELLAKPQDLSKPVNLWKGA